MVASIADATDDGLGGEGASIAEVLDEYPELSEDDVRACFTCGGRRAGGGLTDVM